MRYDAMRKLHRNALLVQYRRDHPEMSWAEIAAVFGITRQRAQAIWQAERRRKEVQC